MKFKEGDLVRITGNLTGDAFGDLAVGMELHIAAIFEDDEYPISFGDSYEGVREDEIELVV